MTTDDERTVTAYRAGYLAALGALIDAACHATLAAVYAYGARALWRHLRGHRQ